MAKRLTDQPLVVTSMASRHLLKEIKAMLEAVITLHRSYAFVGISIVTPIAFKTRITDEHSIDPRHSKVV